MGQRLTRLAALDGLRALAVIIVIVNHSFARLPIGGAGVLIFFVLSGYLITTLLLREMEATGGISLGLFYLRRAVRLYPALVAMLVVTVALGAPVVSALIAGSYTTNLFNSVGIGNAPYGHTWSLALEEQFYLLWPLLLPTVLRHGRRAWAWLALFALASTIAAWAFGVVTNGGAGVMTFNPLFRLQAPIAGCLVALYLHRRVTPLLRPGLLVAAGLALVAAGLFVVLVGSRLPMASIWATLAPSVGTALLIAGLVSGGAPGVSRVLSTWPMLWVGTRSYAIYLWHYPLIVLGESRGWSLPVAAAVGVPASLVLSELSYRWVERPFLRLKERFYPQAPAQSVVLASEAQGSSGIRF